MAEVSVEKRFHGSVVLVILHLRRVAHINLEPVADVDNGIAAGLKLGMINQDDERFIRDCLAMDEAMQAGSQPGQPITVEMVDRLQLCARKLNSADPS